VNSRRPLPSPKLTPLADYRGRDLYIPVLASDMRTPLRPESDCTPAGPIAVELYLEHATIAGLGARLAIFGDAYGATLKPCALLCLCL